MRKPRSVRQSIDGEHNGDHEPEAAGHVAFLTDKCNALALRLQQVEAQLFRERADGKKALHDAASAYSSQSAASLNNSINSGSSRSHNDFSSAPMERHAGAHLRPATVGTAGSSSIANNKREHRSPARLEAHGQQQQHLRPPGLRSGVMVSPDVWKPIKEGKKPQRNGSGKMDDDALHCEIVEQEIADRFGVVTGDIEKLENVFSGAAQILENRVRAITAISR